MKGLLIFICGVSFWVMENRYFGWNWTPQSAEEVIADGIVVLILAISILANP